MRQVLKYINNCLDRVSGYRLQPAADLRLNNSRIDILNKLKCNLVIDAGANIGQWALALRKNGYKGEILSYEPSNLYSKLCAKVKFDPLWEARKCALLDYKGSATLYYSSNNGLSSSTNRPSRILDHDHGIQFPESYPVSVVRLDQEIIGRDNLYLKLDIQGSEMQALLGAQGVINKIAAIEFESSLTDLYENESSHYEIVNWLLSYGFVPWQLVVTHWDRSLRTISLDSIFVRN
jgi:FkbM family methyltransferase